MSTFLLANPSVSGPKLHFGDGLVANNAPGVFASTTASIPGPDDDAWNIVEWSQQQVIDPSAVTVDASSTHDAALGTDATYSWSTPDGETAVKAYDTSSDGWVYDLAGAGTTADTTEHDVFLETAQHLAVNMGGNEVDYAMNAKIVSEGNDPTQPNNNAAYAGVITGFTFNYNLAGQPDYDANQPSFGIFLQIPLSTTQNNSNLVSYFQDPNLLGFFSEKENAAGQPTEVISDQLRSENALLPMDGSATTPESYNLSAYVADLASYLAVEKGLGTGVTDLARWTLGGVYVGVMTQGPSTHADVQISDVSLTIADTPSTSPLQINAPAGSASAPPPNSSPAGSGDNLSSYIVSEDGSGRLQIVSSPSTAPQLSLSGAGEFDLPGGGQGYFDPTGNGEEVARLFQAALGRPPDAGAESFYTAPIDAGSLSLVAVAQDFLTSSEYQTEHGNESNAAFVEDVFQNVLGRSFGDSDGGWVSLLDGGVSKAAVLVGIATSGEAVLHNETWDGSDVYGQDYRAFETVLGRAPDQTAQSWMASMVGNGMTPQGVISALADSSEMLTRYAAETPTAIVESLYQSGLSRAADPSGLANGVPFLESQGSVVSLAFGIANSAEGRNDYASVTHANWVSTPS
jgi:Domain of unknown function (DUF4214)